MQPVLRASAAASRRFLAGNVNGISVHTRLRSAAPLRALSTHRVCPWLCCCRRVFATGPPAGFSCFRPFSGTAVSQLAASTPPHPSAGSSAPSAAEYERVLGKHAELSESYAALPVEYPEHALAADGRDITLDTIVRKRLIYRAKQRGWLEVDLLMGTYATENVPAMTDAELVQFERILGAETIDIYNYVSGKDEVPEELRGSVMDDLQAWAASAPLGKASPEGYAKVKRIMSN